MIELYPEGTTLPVSAEPEEFLRRHVLLGELSETAALPAKLLADAVADSANGDLRLWDGSELFDGLDPDAAMAMHELLIASDAVQYFDEPDCFHLRGQWGGMGEDLALSFHANHFGLGTMALAEVLANTCRHRPEVSCVQRLELGISTTATGRDYVHASEALEACFYQAHGEFPQADWLHITKWPEGYVVPIVDRGHGDAPRSYMFLRTDIGLDTED